MSYHYFHRNAGRSVTYYTDAQLQSKENRLPYPLKPRGNLYRARIWFGHDAAFSDCRRGQARSLPALRVQTLYIPAILTICNASLVKTMNFSIPRKAKNLTSWATAYFSRSKMLYFLLSKRSYVIHNCEFQFRSVLPLFYCFCATR
jgi:hypothetical protein